MALTAHDILMDADLFKRAYPSWPSAPVTRTMPAKLNALRASCIAAGISVESPAVLDPEAELMARLEREDAQ